MKGLLRGKQVVFLWPVQFGWLETDCQTSLQHRQVYLGSAEIYNSVSATLATHMRVPSQPGEGNTFIEGWRKLGEIGWTKSLSMVEPLTGSKRSLFFLLGSSVFKWHETSFFWSLFHWGFCLLIFINDYSLPSKFQKSETPLDYVRD